jgi:AmiR/NasT family two-component response regulator
VLADVATSYVINAWELDKQRRINEQLQEALDSRIIIEQAKGVLAGERGISVGEAFELLRRHARTHNARLRAVVGAVVNLGLRP